MPERRHESLGVLDVAEATFGRDVPAVEERVNEDPCRPSLAGHLKQRVEVLAATVDAAVGQQAHEVHGTPVADGPIDGVAQNLVDEQ